MTCSCGTKIQLVGNATVGDSITNPFNAEWLYAVNKFHDWDCVSTDDGVTYDVSTTIEIGNGIISTFFKDIGRTFRFVVPHSFILNPPAYLELTGGADWTAYEKEQIRDALGVNGNKSSAIDGQLEDGINDIKKITKTNRALIV